MLPSANVTYKQLPVDAPEEHDVENVAAIELTNVGNNDNNNDKNCENIVGNGTMKLKVLCKEKVYYVRVNGTQTIDELKGLIETVSNVAKSQQRLIYNGKLLKNNAELLNVHNISDESTLHLFPMMARTVSIEDGLTQPGNVTNTQTNLMPQYPSVVDPTILQTLREVKLWSLILIFVSSMSLFNNVTLMLSPQQNSNKTLLDNIYTWLEFGTSTLGIYVAQLGLVSVRTLDVNTVKKYFNLLVILAVVSTVKSILWVFDVVDQLGTVIEHVQEAKASDKGAESEPNTDDLYYGSFSDDKVNKQIVHDFTIQASIISFFIIFCWIICVKRALMLRQTTVIYSTLNVNNNTVNS
jgi:hypothetical protein